MTLREESDAEERLVRRFLRELLDSASVLEDLEIRASREAWASSAVAEWLRLGGAEGDLAHRVRRDAPEAAEMIEWIEGAKADGVHHVIVGAAEIRPADQDERAIVVDFETDGVPSHSMSTTIRQGRAIDLAVGPADLVEAVGEDESFTVAPIAVDVAQEAIQASLEAVAPGEMSADSLVNLPLFVRRFGSGPSAGIAHVIATADEKDGFAVAERDSEDDAYAAQMMGSVLRLRTSTDVPPVVGGLVDALQFRIDAADPDTEAIFAVAGLPLPSEPDLDDLLDAAGAYIAPRDLIVHERAAAEAVNELEWADWLGAILGLVRSGIGTQVTGEALVSFINRCPEITTAIPAKDQPRIAWALEETLYAWENVGVLDGDGLLTEAGVWVLPHAAVRAWGPRN